MTLPPFLRRSQTYYSPIMSVIDVLFMAIATAIVAVALYSSAGCGAANFQQLDGEEESDAISSDDTGDAGSSVIPDSRSDETVGNDSTPIDTGLPTVVDGSPLDTSETSTDTKPAPETSDSSCEHSNGLGQSYNLCAPAGTPGIESSYSLDMAKRARAAWTTPGTDGEGACADGAPLMVWRKTATSCAAWAYTNGVGAFAGTAGRVYLGSTACSCPSASCAAWN